MIELVAKLNTKESERKISNDLKQIADNINSQQVFKIIGNLDLRRTTQRIQSQLSTIAKGVNVEIGGVNFDNTNVTQVITKVQDTLNAAGKTAKIDVSINQEAINAFTKELRDMGVYGTNVDKLGERFEKLNIIIQSIDSSYRMLEKDGERVLSNVSVVGTDLKGNTVRYTEQFDKDGSFKNSSIKITENLTKIINAEKKLQTETATAQKSLNEFLVLEGKFNLLNKQYGTDTGLASQFKTISDLIASFDNTAPLDKQREVLIRIDNALKEVKIDIDKINQSAKAVNIGENSFYTPIAKGATTQETITNAKDILNAKFKETAGMENDTASRVKRAIEDTTGALQRFYVQVEKGDKSVETLTYALNKQGTAYEYVGKTIREADNSTDFRQKDIGTQWDIQTEKLAQFIANAEKAGAATTILKDDIANLQAKLQAKGDNTSAMNSFLDDFDIAKAKLQAFNAEIRKENYINNFNNRIRKLTSEMQAYAAANQRAVESTRQMTNGKTFAEEWIRLSNQMAKGASLTDTELKKLSTDMAVFKNEAKAAGLEGASAFEKFANSFKVISTYISANQLIHLAIRKIREAITELKEINNILTEIDKTSERTAESLRKLGEESFNVASKYGRTASDYLLGVQEMSRAGFGEMQSEQLAELSLMAQAAGNMTAEMANQYIIATNAAYKLEGSEYKLNQVLDGQNYITNRNAVNMENLTQATKIAASQAAASGVAIDELTAAVGTMVAVTQQGGEQAGRAFKGILMNIQQVKASAADIGDGGEDITTESLSKYEKAAKALGVSLKEVRNGTLQLREPMAVLRDLSEAVRKESEGSIKVANLISAVGGKFRGNQLIALLQNWDTYEKMLTEFNSDNAIGSAYEEAQKSANNWAGSINKVKNSWADLISQFIKSDKMIDILDSINTLIKGLTDSAATGGLKALTEILSGLLKIIANLSERFGTLSVIAIPFLTKLVTQSRIDLWTGLTKFNATLGTTIPLIQKATIEFENLYHAEVLAADMRGYFVGATNDSSAVGMKFTEITDKSTSSIMANSAATYTMTKSMDGATKSASALGLALKNFLIITTITYLINGFKRVVDILNVDAEESAKKTNEVVNSLKSLKGAMDDLNSEKETLRGIVEDYTNAIFNIKDISDKKEALNKVQESLNSNYGTEAKNIDVVNGEYKEQLGLIEDLGKKKEEEFKIVHAAEIAQAEALSKLYLGEEDFTQTKGRSLEKTGYSPTHRIKEDSLEAMYVLDDMDRYAKEIAESIEGIYKAPVKAVGGINGFYLSGDIHEAKEQMRQLVEEYGKLDQDKYNQKVATILSERYTALLEAVNLIDEMQPHLSNDVTGFFSDVTEALDSTVIAIKSLPEATEVSTDKMKEQWLATLDDMQKGSLKNISTMVSALQDLSEGKGISANTFWQLIEFDTEGLLNGAKLVGDQFYVTQENMMKLKDKYVQAQIDELNVKQAAVMLERDENEALAEQYETTIKLLLAQGKSVFSKEVQDLLKNLDIAKANAKAFGDEWERNNTLIRYLNQSLGNTIDLEKELQAQQKQLNKELTALNKELDDYTKAYDAKIDSIIKGLELELSTLESEKDVLEDELDALNEKKDILEDTLDKYEKVNSYVEKILDKEIKNLEEQRDAIKDTYEERINALKEENEQREDALEYAQKLADLENAKNNKRRVYDEARGWRYESVKEDVVKAQNELDSYNNSQAIKKLEKERDAELKTWNDLIKTKEEYKKLWTEWLEEIQDEESDALALELLGADYRDKIAQGDINLLTDFTSQYRTHNTELKHLVDVEIKMKNEAIDAKNKEIDAKKTQIQTWKDYKTEIKNAVTEIKQANEDYMKKIGDIKLDEASNLETRQIAFENFKDKVTGYIDDIGAKQTEIDTVTSKLEGLQDKKITIDVEVNNGDLDSLIKEYAKLADISMAAAWGKYLFKYGDQLSDEERKNALMKYAHYSTNGYYDSFDKGGTIGYTGLAMVHGTPQQNETIFNATDSAKLYNYIHSTPNLIADAFNQATKLSGFKLASNEVSNNSNVSFYIDKIVTDNPVDFERQLDKYYRTKLTQSYTGRN